MQTRRLPCRHRSHVCRSGGMRSVAASATAIAAERGIAFRKYQGLGNDFILIDNRAAPEPLLTPAQAAKLCDRNFGIGGDGVIFALPPVGSTDLAMRIYNSDGSEPEMCGNGIRCLARFVADVDADSPRKYRIHTLAGVKAGQAGGGGEGARTRRIGTLAGVEAGQRGAYQRGAYDPLVENGAHVVTLTGLIQPELLPDGQVCVDMGEPVLDGPKVPTNLTPTQGSTVVEQVLLVDGRSFKMTCVSMGNPHAVTFSVDGQPIQVDDLDIVSIGPKFEKNAVFPAKTNTEFVEVITRHHVRMVVWERGAGRTLACGTGACATVVAGVLEGKLDRQCKVDLPGGPLMIEWRASDNHVYMTGPAELAFSGVARL